MGRIRLDKWLWAARFFKTRSLAAEAVVSGRVRVNGMVAKPARELRPGGGGELDLLGDGVELARIDPEPSGLAQRLAADLEQDPLASAHRGGTGAGRGRRSGGGAVGRGCHDGGV